MNFEFSSEQEALRQQLQRLFEQGPAQARRLIEATGDYDAALWTGTVEMGLTGTAIAERHGGLGLGALELCVIAEESGRRLAPVPIASSVFHATEALRLAGGEATDALLGRFATGTAIGTVAFVEDKGRTWITRPAATVREDRLHGTKTVVADAGAAGFAVVSAVGADDAAGYGWWLADLNAPGVKRRAVTAIDRLRKHYTVEFNGVPVQRLGAAGAGAALGERLLDRAAVLTAFEQLGGAEAMLAMALEYARTRKAFGAPIGSVQAVKHRLADMYTRIQLARGHCFYGAWALATDAPELPVAAAGARLAATDAFSFAAEEGIELHGGIGFTWENDCQLYLRRARLLALTLGSRSRWADRLVTALTARRAAA